MLISLLPYGAPQGAAIESGGKLDDIEKALHQERQQSEELQKKSETLRRDLADLAHKLVTAARRFRSMRETSWISKNKSRR